MKSYEEVKAETKFGDVFYTEAWISLVLDRCIIPYDGDGYFHDGEQETDKNVWCDFNLWDTLEHYPYVIWYNK